MYFHRMELTNSWKICMKKNTNQFCSPSFEFGAILLPHFNQFQPRFWITSTLHGNISCFLCQSYYWFVPVMWCYGQTLNGEEPSKTLKWCVLAFWWGLCGKSNLKWTIFIHHLFIPLFFYLWLKKRVMEG